MYIPQDHEHKLFDCTQYSPFNSASFCNSLFFVILNLEEFCRLSFFIAGTPAMGLILVSWVWGGWFSCWAGLVALEFAFLFWKQYSLYMYHWISTLIVVLLSITLSCMVYAATFHWLMWLSCKPYLMTPLTVAHRVRLSLYAVISMKRREDLVLQSLKKHYVNFILSEYQCK